MVFKCLMGCHGENIGTRNHDKFLAIPKSNRRDDYESDDSGSDGIHEISFLNFGMMNEAV